MLDYIWKIDPDLYRMLESLLKTGKVERNGKLLDLSPVQTITIQDGLVKFDPPLRVAGKFGSIRVNTTITEVRAKADSSIFVDIDSSPINLEIHPQ